MAPCLAEHIDSRKINKIMSDIKKLLQKIDTIGTPIMEDAALPKKFPGYLKGTDTAKDVENKMVGMEEGSTATLAGQTLAKKAASKIIPGVGTALSYKDAWDRWQKGDKVGAAMAGAAGTAFLVPGPGTAVGTALDAANIGRDIKAGEYDDLFKEENVLKKKNKKHDAEIDESLFGDALRYGAKGARWVKNLIKQKSTPPRVEPTGGIPAGTGTAAGDRVAPGMYNVPAVRRNTDVVPSQATKQQSTSVATRQNTQVGPARTLPKKDSDVIDVDAKEVKPGPSKVGRAATIAAAAGAGAGGGYWAGASSDTPSSQTASDQSAAETNRLQRTGTAAATSTPVPPSEPVVTVNTQAEPERRFAAPLPGSGFRAPAGASIPTRDFDTGGSAPDSDFVSRTTPRTPQEFRFTQEQEAWLGGANRQDPYIINRMLKKVGGPQPPASYFKSDEDRGIAKNLGFSVEPIIPLRPEVSQLSRDEINSQITSQVPRSTDSSERVSSRGPSRGSYQWASGGSNMAENKHNIVNRLSRQFENYLDNRFDIVENNYIPKKKKFRVEAAPPTPNAQDPNTQTTSPQQQTNTGAKDVRAEKRAQQVDIATAKNTMSGLKNVLGPSLDINQAASAVVKINDQKPLTDPEQQAMSAITPLIAKAAETPQTASNLKNSLSNAAYLAKLGK